MSYFTTQTEKYESFESKNPKWVEGQQRFLEYCLPFKKDARIMDIGCGDGTGLEYLRSQGYEKLFGVEFNPRKAQMARKHGTVFESDINELHIPHKFNVVIASHVLEHTDPMKSLANIHKILKGDLFVVLPFPDTGPDDAHVGKHILGTADGDFEKLDKLFQSFNFTLKKYKLDDFREPEIWLHYALS